MLGICLPLGFIGLPIIDDELLLLPVLLIHSEHLDLHGLLVKDLGTQVQNHEVVSCESHHLSVHCLVAKSLE